MADSPISADASLPLASTIPATDSPKNWRVLLIVAVIAGSALAVGGHHVTAICTPAR